MAAAQEGEVTSVRDPDSSPPSPGLGPRPPPAAADAAPAAADDAASVASQGRGDAQRRGPSVASSPRGERGSSGPSRSASYRASVGEEAELQETITDVLEEDDGPAARASPAGSVIDLAEDTVSPRSQPLPQEGERVFASTYETQRWFPIYGWGKKRLPTDCPEWVDGRRKPKRREDVQLPKGCHWDGEWEVDHSPADADGWEYTGDWWWKYHSPERKGDCVRRRKWRRAYFRVSELRSFDTAEPRQSDDELDATAAFAKQVTADSDPLDSTASEIRRRGTASPRPGADPPARDQLHKTFAELPPEERAVADFQCSYKASNKIDRLGRMWITNDHVCFSSPLLSPPLVWHFKDVTDLHKKKDLVVLSAIVVSVGGADHTFTAFARRDAAFEELYQQWSAVQKREGRDAQAMLQAGAEGRERKQKQRKSGRSPQPRAAAPSPPTSPPPSAAPAAGADKDADKDAPAPAAGAGPADMPALFADTPLSGAFLAEAALLSSKDVKQIHAAHKLPQGADIGAVQAALLQPPFLEQYHKKGGRYAGPKASPESPVMPPWEGGKSNLGWRELNCTTVVQAPFTTHTKYVEKQRYCLLAGPPRQLLIHFVSQTPEVTMGDAFRIEVLVTVEEKASKQCEMTVHGLVHFLKSSWLKGKITSTAHAELTTAYEGFVRQAHAQVAAQLSGGTAVPPADAAAPSAAVGAGAPAAAAVTEPAKSPWKPELNADTALRALVVVLLLWALWSAWSAASATREAAQLFADVAASVATAGRCAEVPGCDGTKAAEALAEMLRGDAAAAAAGASAVVASQGHLAALLALCAVLGASSVALLCAV
eukprot:TRINITY_DN16031_c0_g1_i1.p1 TRINITY_DN16031_c0_g1~~TRINITY_DN16031_c0_g1_i1.p1  ORF type:complete len:842 (+),score=335.23 TRINITY_DN16031_c0_g1_i1:51-2528(+)